ncbi:hypothetical protein OJAV_G00217620 [Oryzias javanicus]|uniref:Uncharacterized protein n=1 Tax=Oryzias javanicus TaxID=123683 RepID=A0A437C4G9_ORYJA|nr:hypothetical protein OJAV_G00217620 [Oryzias javanicus]
MDRFPLQSQHPSFCVRIIPPAPPVFYHPELAPQRRQPGFVYRRERLGARTERLRLVGSTRPRPWRGESTRTEDMCAFRTDPAPPSSPVPEEPEQLSG